MENINTDDFDYKDLVSLIKEMQNQYSNLKKITEDNTKNNYGLNSDIFDALLPYTKEMIETISLEEGKNILIKYSTEDNANNLLTYDKDKTEEENVREILSSIKEDSLNLLKSKCEMDSLQEESKEILDEHFNYMTSPKAQARQMEKLAKLKEAAEKEEDEKKKKEMIVKIEAMENAFSLDFVSKRLSDLGKKEIDWYMDAFFKEEKGSYIIKKYSSKIKNFGFKNDMYKCFLNLEENFLEEEYHAFNNLFLFISMKFIAYADPYNKTDIMEVKSLINNMANLVYHKFASNEKEKNFVNTIKTVIDYFKEYKDYFEKNNTTNPKHPMRIEAEERHSKLRKESLIKKMDDMKITGYDENESADKLQEYFNEKVDEMIKDQVKETNTDTVEVNEDEDGTVSIQPTMKPVEEDTANIDINDDGKVSVQTKPVEEDKEENSMVVSVFNKNTERCE